jgi:DnaJ-class molecular chaperone
MKTTKTYPSLCTTCQGSGFVISKSLSTSSTTEICPVCNGTKVMTVTEITEGEYTPNVVYGPSKHNPPRRGEEQS